MLQMHPKPKPDSNKIAFPQIPKRVALCYSALVVCLQTDVIVLIHKCAFHQWLCAFSKLAKLAALVTTNSPICTDQKPMRSCEKITRADEKASRFSPLPSLFHPVCSHQLSHTASVAKPWWLSAFQRPLNPLLSLITLSRSFSHYQPPNQPN